MEKNNVLKTLWESHIINPKGHMPIGVSSFQELTSEDYTYVDKSLFIKEILDSGNKVVLITRPRRFGKTLNMSMLHEFLAEKNPKNDPFEELAIAHAGAKYQEERGKRPVLFLSFKDIKGTTWAEAFTQILNLLSALIARHMRSIEDSIQKLILPYREILESVYTRKATQEDCSHALVILTELLTIHYHKKPWVLIDEYDTPMQTAYQHGFYEEMRKLMQGLLSKCLKDNIDEQTREPFLHKSVVTGIVRVAKEDIFSGLNNLGTYGVLEKKFTRHFGFTQEEVNGLLAQKGLSAQKEVVQNWYNGYQFGSETIYNPWSIINFIDNEDSTPKLYWINSSSNALVHKLLRRADVPMKKRLQKLLEHPPGYTIVQNIPEYLPLSQLEKNPSNVWAILLASGYFTTKSHRLADIGTSRTAEICLPNKEIKRLYQEIVANWLEGGHIAADTLTDYLLQGNLQSFTRYFTRFFRETVSYFDVYGDEPERFYHGVIIGLLQHLQNEYQVLSQRESGGGRYDLALEPKDKSQPGFLFEFKTLNNPRKKALLTQLEAAATEALEQIKNQEYARQLFAAGVSTVHALGLAFSGKEVCVVFESLTETP